jgi:hypothetical protein
VGVFVGYIFALMGATPWVAWIGACTGVASLAWNIYVKLTSGARIIVTAFQHIIMMQTDTGMFTKRGSNIYFFSTGATRIGPILERAYAAIECSAPKRSGLSMLVVNFDGRDVPFAPEA